MPMKLKDRLGQRYGKLVVIALVKIGALSFWQVRCDCGVTKRLPTGRVAQIRSCGCLRSSPEGRKTSSEAHAIHGHAGAIQSRTYGSWLAMRKRCFDPKNCAYERYGGRGITICDRWLVFENFLADMGERPAGLTIDRFPNGDGNYEPGNCRWATAREQTRNSRAAKLQPVQVTEIHGRVEHGENLTSVARRFGISRTTVRHIIDGHTWPEFKRAS